MKQKKNILHYMAVRLMFSMIHVVANFYELLFCL